MVRLPIMSGKCSLRMGLLGIYNANCLGMLVVFSTSKQT